MFNKVLHADLVKSSPFLQSAAKSRQLYQTGEHGVKH